MIFFPVGTDRHLKATPWVNYTLIGLNVIVYLLTASQVKGLDAAIRQFAETPPYILPPVEDLINHFWIFNYYLHPSSPQLHQFFTSVFLHADEWHLIGNMVFLYVFGNGVEDRLGKVGYLAFYLAGGVVAGLGHCLVSPAPVLGASGAVAAVTGMFLALFPMAIVTIVYWMIIFGSFEVSSMVLILFRVIMDAVFQVLGIGGVAYTAHLAGYGFGFGVGMALLLTRLLRREPYDMLALIEHRRRRAQFKRMAREGYQPWERNKVKDPSPDDQAKPLSPQQQKLRDQRARVIRALHQHDLPTAAEHYATLLQEFPDQVMNQQQQLDLANQLMSDRQYGAAASAYELLLSKFNSYSGKAHVQLILGMIYARYLDQPNRARALLEEARHQLDTDDRAMAEKVLGELKSKQ